MATKPKTRDAKADAVQSLLERRKRYVKAGLSTDDIDARLAHLGPNPDGTKRAAAGKTAPAAQPAPAAPAPAPVAVAEANSGNDDQDVRSEPAPEAPAENKALSDEAENAKDKAQRENKAVPPSRPANPHKPNAPRPGQGGRAKG